jgi:hypothetical protein
VSARSSVDTSQVTIRADLSVLEIPAYSTTSNPCKGERLNNAEVLPYVHRDSGIISGFRGAAWRGSS